MTMEKRRTNPGRSRTEPSPVIFCDFDGTITQVDVTDLILSELAHPAWQEVEQEWVRGVIGSRECLERQMALVQATVAELRAVVDSIPVDPSFARFVRFTRGARIPLYIVSDGFDSVIRRVLRRAGMNGSLGNGARLFASSLRVAGKRMVTSFPYAGGGCRHGCGTCKAELVRRLGRGHDPVIYIGDGLSDRFAVEQATVVFAKRQLAAYCRERAIPFRPFESFAEIESVLFSASSGVKSFLPQRPQRMLADSGR